MPLEAISSPWIHRRLFSRDQRLDQVVGGQEETSRHHVRTDRRQLMVDLKLIGVGVVTPGHPERPHDELGNECQIESDEDQNTADPPEKLVVHLPGYLWPPVMEASNEADQTAPHHDIVEVRHHEVGVMKVRIDAEHAEEQSSQPANGEKEDERDPVQHCGVENNRTLVHGGEPVEDLDRRGDSDREGDPAEDDAHRGRLPTGEHVVSPDKERKDRDGHR